MADVSKIKLPDNTEVNIKDSRIPGIDSTPTSGSTNPVTSGGVKTALDNYLPLAGGQMTGPLTWVGTSALPKTTSASYFLAIQAFADGGTTQWITAADAAASLGINNYLPLSGGTMSNTNLVTKLNADLLDSLEGAVYRPTAAYNYGNGYLVKTDIDSTSSSHFYYRIEGKTHSSTVLPFFVFGSAYYDVSTFNYSNAVSLGGSFGDISLFAYDGYIYLWFSQPNNYCRFFVTVYVGSVNHVESITNSAKPSSVSSLKTVTPKRFASSISEYGITDAKISNGTITLGQNTITPITSESDPVFVASPAFGISTSDITKWNSAPTYYTGTSDPSSSLGNDGDIYLKLSS